MGRLLLPLLLVLLLLRPQCRAGGEPKPDGELPPVLWMAPLFSGGGYCSEAIAFVTALRRLGHAVSIEQHGDAVSEDFLLGLPPGLKGELLRMYETPFHPGDGVVVCHSEPGAWHPPNYHTSRCPPRGAAVAVGRTMFETDRLPGGWPARLNGMDEVWVPTAFQRDVFLAGGVAPGKLRVLGEGVDTDFFRPQGGRTDGGRFVFLSVFKWERRKGWDVLLAAYFSEFTAEEAVELRVLTSSYHGPDDFDAAIERFLAERFDCDAAEDRIAGDLGSGATEVAGAGTAEDPYASPLWWCLDESAAAAGGEEETIVVDGSAGRARLRRRARASLPRVELLTKVPTGELPGVYEAADAFALPSRGEGWGRPHVEAMSMELPIIATNWSGPTAFMTPENAYPLRYDGLAPIPDGAFRGHLMAEPSVEHLRALMRRVVANPEEARAKGKRARQDMVREFSADAMAEQASAELQRLWRERARRGEGRSGDDEL